MRLFLLLFSLFFSLNSIAMEDPDFELPSDTPEQRLTKCMYYLDASFNAKRSAKVIQVGPSLRRKVPGLSNAIVVMDFETVWGNILVLRPISAKSLRRSANEPINIMAGQLHTLELSADEHYEFEVEGKKIGSITLTFENREVAKKKRRFSASTVGPGSILKIDNKYYAVVNKATGTFGEHGTLPKQTDIFELAAFDGKPSKAKKSQSQLYTLEIGGFWGHELDGKKIGSIENLGQAVLDVHRRIGPTSNPKFSSTVVDWAEENNLSPNVNVPALKAEQYQPSSSKPTRLIEEHPNFASIVEDDPKLQKLLETDKTSKQ